MEAKNKIAIDNDFQERKVKVEEEIKKILDKEGLGMQAIIQRTDLASAAVLIFIDVRAIEEAKKEEEKEDVKTKSN